MENETTGKNPSHKPEVRQESDSDSVSERREKEVSRTQQSTNEPSVEKAVTRQRRAEVQNPLMHESY